MSTEQAQREYDWFYITEVTLDTLRKKRRFVIRDKKFKLKRSRIQWDDGLECYVFAPANKVIWNAEALADIVEFLAEVNDV